MFVSDRVVFVELHKTGGTHIGRWLGELLGGEQLGKHNRVPAELRSRFVMGSVRNPWDWYVSLWAYGCGGKGSVRAQTTRRISVGYCLNSLPREMGKQRLAIREWLRQMTCDAVKPVDAWRRAYCSSQDAIAFRQWIGMLLDPSRKFDMGEGYGFSPVAEGAGLMTYRYLKLFTGLGERLYTDPSLGSLDAMREASRKELLVSHFIRTETLEEDLLEGLRAAGVDLDPAVVQRFRAAATQPVNSSQRGITGSYYDEASVRLVAKREALIIDRHGYEPPSPVDGEVV